jgi:hypothetical protein
MTVDQVVPFTTGDGRALNLVHVHGTRAPTREPVLLVHGAGVRANTFRPPVALHFVDALLAHGHDVWLENWRASIDLPPCDWTLDQAALHDHPAAVRAVLAQTGATSLKAVIHCQGSTSFTMSAVAGLLPQVDVIVSNAVSLHPQVCAASHIKSQLAQPLVGLLTDHLNPQWGDGLGPGADRLALRALRTLARLTHRECDNGVCRFASFTYGTGFPVLWPHDQLSDTVHDWFRGEFGAGRRNDCFQWQGQRSSFEWFDRHQPGRHAPKVFDDDGHVDVFIGRHAARDTFPVMLAALDGPLH